MKNVRILFLLALVIVNLSLVGAAQDLHIGSLLENIRINQDSSFTTHITVSIKRSDKVMLYPIFYDQDLEEVSDVGLFLKKGKRFKKEKEPIITDNDLQIDYITSKKIKSIQIPAETEVEINYRIKCNELMYLSSLRFFSYDDVDTLKYEIIVPDEFHLTYNWLYCDSLEYLVIDSLKTDGATVWNIELVPVKIKPDLLNLFGIYKNIKAPIMRSIVVPAAYKNREREYLNNWYLDNVESQRGLDSLTMHKIDELTMGISDPMRIMDTLYTYVKMNFKYVAIEVGMGAFVPTHANEVFLNKQGDCKDLSNFLSEALNYKGIKSDIALASTYNYISDCDFPSLSSANHVICVVWLNEQPILLDPTDPIHQPFTPVESLQQRTILIIHSNGGEYYRQPISPPRENQITYTIDLKADAINKQMVGTFNVRYAGISGNFLQRTFFGLKKDEIHSNGIKYFKSVLGNQSVSEVSFHQRDSMLKADGNLTVSGKIFDDTGKRFLFLDFLPRLFEQELRETLLEGTFLGHSIAKKVRLTIEFDQPFEDFKPIEHNFTEEGVSLNFSIAPLSDTLLTCEYEFLFNDVFIDQQNLERTNELLKTFKKITNEPIILHNK